MRLKTAPTPVIVLPIVPAGSVISPVARPTGFVAAFSADSVNTCDLCMCSIVASAASSFRRIWSISRPSTRKRP